MFPSFRPQPRPCELQWKYVPIRCGAEMDGWIAGPLICVPVHWSDSSKPCRRRLTEGKLDCPMCAAQMKVRLIGYQPLIDRRGRKVVVTVSETVAEIMMNFGLGVDVKFSRTSGARDPVRVRVLTGSDTTRPPTYFANLDFRKSGGWDIRPWLVHLWQDPYLTAFYSPAPTEGTTVHNVPSPTLPPPADPPPPPPPPASAEDLAKLRAFAASIDAVDSGTVSPIQSPSRGEEELNGSGQASAKGKSRSRRKRG